MFKNINSEKYAKSILDVDYWKTRTFEEEMKVFYKEENKKLKAEIERLEKLLDSEHHCNKNCFAEHVLPAIQSDYNYKTLEFMLDRDKRHYFLKYWNKKLKNEYDFIENLYMIADTIMVRFN